MSDARTGHWFETYTGQKFWPLDPRKEDINLYDIAWALSHICRFGGHALCFYSVAQHSIWVSRHVPPELALAGLLHDAHEAYVGDMIRPLKREVNANTDGFWSLVEHKIQKCITDVLGGAIPDQEASQAISKADNQALATERRDLRRKTDHPWECDGLEQETRIVAHEPWLVNRLFLDRYEELTR